MRNGFLFRLFVLVALVGLLAACGAAAPAPQQEEPAALFDFLDQL